MCILYKTQALALNDLHVKEEKDLSHKLHIVYKLLLNSQSPFKKRFYTRGTLRSIRIPRLAKITTLYRD